MLTVNVVVEVKNLGVKSLSLSLSLFFSLDERSSQIIREGHLATKKKERNRDVHDIRICNAWINVTGEIRKAHARFKIVCSTPHIHERLLLKCSTTYEKINSLARLPLRITEKLRAYV